MPARFDYIDYIDYIVDGLPHVQGPQSGTTFAVVLTFEAASTAVLQRHPEQSFVGVLVEGGEDMHLVIPASAGSRSC